MGREIGFKPNFAEYQVPDSKQENKLSKPDDDFKGLYVVFAQPVDGEDADLNCWHDKQHLPDLLAVLGRRDV